MRKPIAGDGRRALVVAAALVGWVAAPACNDVLGVSEFRTAACTTGQKRCADNAPERCGDDGTWARDAPCVDATCQEGVCQGECAPAGMRCAGDMPQVCGEDGYWRDTTPCAPGGCRGGECTTSCSPGDTRCAGPDAKTPQRCDGEGRWQDQAACPPCKTCDVNLGACPPWADPDGSPCTDPEDRCVVGACQSGQCVPTRRIDCPAPGADPCSSPTCDPQTGTCVAPDETRCDDGAACTITDACVSGTCTARRDGAWAHWSFPDRPPPFDRFQVRGDVVFDSWTRLTWQRVLQQDLYTWSHARSYCAELDLGGYTSGWRLPTRIELVSIVSYEGGATIDESAFPGTPRGPFWTSSTSSRNTTSAWFVSFAEGRVQLGVKSEPFGYRCVR